MYAQFKKSQSGFRNIYQAHRFSASKKAKVYLKKADIDIGSTRISSPVNFVPV
jgi:hypothetical protein